MTKNQWRFCAILFIRLPITWILNRPGDVMFAAMLYHELSFTMLGLAMVLGTIANYITFLWIGAVFPLLRTEHLKLISS
jgi:hypothetical protein